MPNIIRTTCSGCMEPVKVDVENGVVTMRVPSNGIRGDKHVPAHDVTTEGWIEEGDDTLITWDCPRCEYADSAYTDPAMRAVLA